MICEGLIAEKTKNGQKYEKGAKEEQDRQEQDKKIKRQNGFTNIYLYLAHPAAESDHAYPILLEYLP